MRAALLLFHLFGQWKPIYQAHYRHLQDWGARAPIIGSFGNDSVHLKTHFKLLQTHCKYIYRCCCQPQLTPRRSHTHSHQIPPLKGTHLTHRYCGLHFFFWILFLLAIFVRAFKHVYNALKKKMKKPARSFCGPRLILRHFVTPVL